MLRMVSYPHRPQSGHITCYLNRTYHVLPTCPEARFDRRERLCHTAHDLPMSRRRAILLSPFARLVCVPFFLGWVLILTATAQSPGDNLNGQGSLKDQLASLTSYPTAPNTGVIILNVFAERSGAHLDRQALLKLVDRSSQNATWATTGDAAQGVFTNIAYGNYDVEVSAVGYLSTHKELQVVPTLIQLQLDIVLHRDPSAINLDLADSILSPKGRKEARRAVTALKSGNLTEAQKQLDAAYKSAPTSPDLDRLGRQYPVAKGPEGSPARRYGAEIRESYGSTKATGRGLQIRSHQPRPEFPAGLSLFPEERFRASRNLPGHGNQSEPAQRPG